MLARRFRRRVAPAIDTCRAEHTVAVFVEGHLRVAAVNLRCRAEHDLLAVAERRREHRLGAVDVDREHLIGVADVVLHTNHRGEVIYEIRPRDDPFEDVRLQHGFTDDPKARLLAQMSNLHVGCEIEHRHFVAAVEKRLGKMRAHEARAAGDEHFHGRILTLLRADDRLAVAPASAPTSPLLLRRAHSPAHASGAAALALSRRRCRRSP